MELLLLLCRIQKNDRSSQRIFFCRLDSQKYRASTQIPLGSCSDSYICQVSRQLIENKNDLLKLVKPKWPPQPRFQSHMKTDNTNRLADYIPGFGGILKKKSLKKN